MDRHPNDLTTDEEIDAGLERAKRFDAEPRILEAVFRSEPDLDLLMLKLSDGRRLVFPREQLPELRHATPEQTANFVIGTHGRDLWWPLLDDGIYLPNLLDQHERSHRPGEAAWEPAEKRLGWIAATPSKHPGAPPSARLHRPCLSTCWRGSLQRAEGPKHTQPGPKAHKRSVERELLPDCSSPP